MGKYAQLFEYFRECPQLEKLLSIAGNAEKGNTIILPQGASPAVQYIDNMDALGGYECNIIPYPSIYEDFQINCYEWYDAKDTNPPKYNDNVLTYEQVCDICDWIREQDLLQNYPQIGEQIVSIECEPFVPQIRFVDEATNTIGFFITVRIRYVNRLRVARSVEYELGD